MSGTTNGLCLEAIVVTRGKPLPVISWMRDAKFLSRRIFDGLEQFAVWENPNGCSASLQADIPVAKDTIRRIKLMEKELGCHVAFAHDTEWMKKGLDQTLMGMLDTDMKRATKERLPFQAVV